MRIRGFVWSSEVEDKIYTKHNLTQEEVESAFSGSRGVRRAPRGTYILYARTDAGRYIVVFFGFRSGLAYIASARDMNRSERRYYQREFDGHA